MKEGESEGTEEANYLSLLFDFEKNGERKILIETRSQITDEAVTSRLL